MRKKELKDTLRTNKFISTITSSTNFIWKTMNWEQKKGKFRGTLTTNNKLIYKISSWTNSIWWWDQERKKFQDTLTKDMKLKDILQTPVIYPLQLAKATTPNLAMNYHCDNLIVLPILTLFTIKIIHSCLSFSETELLLQFLLTIS